MLLFKAIQTVIYDDKETNDETEINNYIYSFFNYLYKDSRSFSNNNQKLISISSFPKVTKQKSKTPCKTTLCITKTSTNKIN